MEITDLAWDEENEAKLASHGVAPERVDEVAQGPCLVLRNKKGRRGQKKMVGGGLRRQTLDCDSGEDAVARRMAPSDRLAIKHR